MYVSPHRPNQYFPQNTMTRAYWMDKKCVLVTSFERRQHDGKKHQTDPREKIHSS